ncbi:hypothetical protein ACQPYE_27140 [Actinosynnema sp. CA-299493]
MGRMRTYRIVPVLAAAVMMTVSGAAADGAGPAATPHREVAAPAAAGLPPMALLFATSQRDVLTTLRVEVCTGAEVAGTPTFKVDVKTSDEPVNPACVNATLPEPPQRHRATDPRPRVTADTDNDGISIANAVNINAININLCVNGEVTVIGPIVGSENIDPDACKKVPLGK